MFDIGWTEMLVIAVVAIVVIGPKELPRALRTAGQWMGKARGLARDFQRHVDDMVRESELEELRQKANAIQNYDPSGLLEDEDPTGGKPAEPEKPAVTATATPVAPPHSLGDTRDQPANEAEAAPEQEEGARAAPAARG